MKKSSTMSLMSSAVASAEAPAPASVALSLTACSSVRSISWRIRSMLRLPIMIMIRKTKKPMIAMPPSSDRAKLPERCVRSLPRRAVIARRVRRLRFWVHVISLPRRAGTGPGNTLVQARVFAISMAELRRGIRKFMFIICGLAPILHNRTDCFRYTGNNARKFRAGRPDPSAFRQSLDNCLQDLNHGFTSFLQ